jgi:hypothetical protein
MLRLTLWLSLAASTWGACTHDVSVGDARDREELREDEELDELALRMEGTWRANVSTFGEISFEPGTRPRAGEFTVECADFSQCSEFMPAFRTISDGGTMFVHPRIEGRYQLLERIEGDLALCVLTSKDESGSMTWNVRLSPDSQTLEFKLPGLESVGITLTRE